MQRDKSLGPGAYVDRREFTKTIALASGTAALIGVPLVAAVVAPALKDDAGRWVDFGKAAELVPGDFSKLNYDMTAQDGWLSLPRRGFVWVRPEPQGGMCVFASTCTHLSCNVIWRRESGHFECPCHSGRFDAAGKPVAGPPKRQLQVLPHKVEEGNLWIHVTF